MKSQMQERVRYHRCQVKQECYIPWNNTPEAEREALFGTPAFSMLDRGACDDLCEYYASEEKKEEARRNAENRASNLHGRATYTGGSRNMSRSMGALKGQIIEEGGTPTILKLYLGTHSSSVNKITGEYIYPDNGTEEYCNRVIEKATLSGLDSTTEDDPLPFTQMLDSLHGGHHGGYERAMGIGAARSYLRASSVPEIGTSNQELRHELVDLRSRVAAMDSLREELTSQMHWINNHMVNSQSPRLAPTPTDPPSFTRLAPISQPATDIPPSARPTSTTHASTSNAQGSAHGLSQENITRMFADFRRSGLSQEDILRGISSIP